MKKLRKFKKLIVAVALAALNFCFNFVCGAQMTTVTATSITDSDGTLWANGTVAVQFVPNPAQPNPGAYKICSSGALLNPTLLNQAPVTLAGAAGFSVTTYDNSQVCPQGSQWQFTVCPNASSKCGIITLPVSGTTQSITTQVNVGIPAPRFAAIANNFGYADVEAQLQLVPGGLYYNVTDLCYRQFSGATFSCLGAGNPFTIPIPLNQGGSAATTAAGAFTNIVAPGGSLTGPLNGPAINSIFNAASFPGSDCGAKIMAALTSSSGLNGQPGTVQVNNACGMAWTTAVTVGTNQSLQLTQAGVYTVTHPITLGQEASLSAATPRGSSNFSAYTLQAAAGADLTNLLTMEEGSTVADINLDGNQANGGMTGLSSAVLTTVTNGGQKIKDTFAINSSGIGFSITQENVDISHSFAQFNSGQGLLCTDTADLWISGESQFESNGLSGIELNGCGSVRVVHADVSGNGSSGVAGTTGCSIYIHGTVAHTSNTNIFTEVQSGNDFFEDVCDIGFDSVGGNFGNAENTFIGYQSLGSPNRTVNTVPAILAQDMNGDQFIGGTLLPGPHAASFGIEFTETASGRANASTVIGVDFNTGFGTANYISSTANQNYFNGNVEGLTGFSQMGPHAYIVNGGCLYFDNTSADPECTLFADTGNNMNIVDAGGGAINMSTQTGAGIAEFNTANSTIQGSISNSHTVLIPSGTTNQLPEISSGTQVAGQVACIKTLPTSTTPLVIGTCSGTVNATTGACGTCN
jgi:hypothetical protein